jgi:hypothetical protein
MDLDAGEDAGVEDAGPSDSGADADAGLPDAGQPDAGMADAGIPDAGAPDAGMPDAGRPDAGAPDAGPVDAGPTHVHILISNTCVVQVQPPMITAPLNSNLRLTFHNHSADYEADVWSSRGYGYLQLATGGTWNDPINHCGGPMAYTEYFDIGIAGGGGSSCPDVRFNIRCQ